MSGEKEMVIDPMPDFCPSMTHDPATRGGSVVRMDSLLHEPGMLDPMRYVRSGDVAGSLSRALAESVVSSDKRFVKMDLPEDADGSLDPLSCTDDLGWGIERAVGILIAVNPWDKQGADVGENLRSELLGALRYGVDRGARTTGSALSIALDADVVDQDLVAPVLSLRATSPFFAALCGMDKE